MPKRRIPPEIMAYLGPCREPRGIVEKVLEQCYLAVFMGESHLVDYAPLVAVLHLVTVEIRNMGLSFDKPRTRRAWCKIVNRIQEGDELGLDHNSFIPCRSCDQAFEPAIDDKLLTLFLTWYQSGDFHDLLAIHRCAACGGQLGAKRTKKYEGDMHTPEPRSVENDTEWVDLLLQYTEL